MWSAKKGIFWFVLHWILLRFNNISCIYYCCFFCEFVFLSFDILGVFIIFLYGFIDSLYYGYYYLPGRVCYWYFVPSVAYLLILSAVFFVKQNIWIFMLQSVSVFLSTLGFNKNLCSVRREIWRRPPSWEIAILWLIKILK